MAWHLSGFASMPLWVSMNPRNLPASTAKSPSFLPLFFSSTVPHFHLRFHHAREKETLKENPSFSSSLLVFSHRRRRVASQGRRRWVAVAEEQSIHREAVLSPSSSPVAKQDSTHSSGRRSPTRAPSSTPVTKPSPAESNSTMSSSEPTSNEVPSERTPLIGGEIVESAVRSSTDSGVLTKPPPHPRSKKRKVHSTNVGATPGATPTNPSPSTVETDEEDSKDKANEGNRKPSRPRSWTWEHFTRDPKSKPSHPRDKCN
ncbi:uncharacterized protein [Arachis hypogaea]|uniref:uncharacterized protein n=1 Tax=Arachis hypogaea TaxID=3818 RepID=UPI000DECA355|nr:putative protein TPRXL [Arachis hypogaea]